MITPVPPPTSLAFHVRLAKNCMRVLIAESLAEVMKELRLLDLRAQARRKGSPGWRHMRVLSERALTRARARARQMRKELDRPARSAAARAFVRDHPFRFIDELDSYPADAFERSGLMQPNRSPPDPAPEDPTPRAVTFHAPHARLELLPGNRIRLYMGPNDPVTP